MIEKKIITTKKAPAAVGPYSQAVIAGKFIFLSGQIGIDPKNGKMVGGKVEDQARQIFLNIKNVLEKAGSDMGSVVKATVFLKDMNNFSKVNEIYSQNFSKPFPARSAIEVSNLPLSADIEIEVTAVI